MELEHYTFVLLRRGPRAFAYSERELERLQVAHLAFLESMRERGLLLVAGPFGEQPDETLRGFCLYGAGIDETRDLVAADPAVVAGRLVTDVMIWSTKRGALSFDETV